MTENKKRKRRGLYSLYLKGEKSTRADRILYLVTVVVSVVIIWLGYRLAVADGTVLGQDLGGIDAEQYRARITEVVSSTDIHAQYSDSIAERRTVCYATLLTGPDKGEQILVTQVQDTTTLTLDDPCTVGDEMYVYLGQNEYGEDQWFTSGHVRTDWLLMLAVVFVALVVAFGGVKGVRTLLSLGLTCLAIFAVLIPLIVAGYNIYWAAIGVCLYTIVVTLALVSGWRVKSLAAGIGCAGGVLVAGLITIVSEYRLHMTGIVDDDSMLLMFINEEHPIDLKGIVFAAIIIGAVGATMDVGMDIAASLTEIYHKNPDIGMRELARSGFTIGRDIMGTMSNTLVLAYIGSGLHVTLLFMTYYDSLETVLNVEMMTNEVLQALAGSIGIVFTIPTTTLATVFLYALSRRRQRRKAAKAGAGGAQPLPAEAAETAAAEAEPEEPANPEDAVKTALQPVKRVYRRPEEVPFLRVMTEKEKKDIKDTKEEG